MIFNAEGCSGLIDAGRETSKLCGTIRGIQPVSGNFESFGPWPRRTLGKGIHGALQFHRISNRTVAYDDYFHKHQGIEFT